MSRSLSLRRPRRGRPGRRPRPGPGSARRRGAPGSRRPQRRPPRAAAAAEPLPTRASCGCGPSPTSRSRRATSRRAGSSTCASAAMRIQADKADVYEDVQPDGSVKRRLVAEGNVVFIRGEERLSGDRVEMDESGRGFFENAVGFVEPGVFVEGRRVERVDDDTYRVEGGKFTSCAQPNPRWSFSASSARVEVDDKIMAKNAVFKVKGDPGLLRALHLLPDPQGRPLHGLSLPPRRLLVATAASTSAPGSSGRWAAASTRPSTRTTTRRSATASATSCATPRSSPSRGTFRTYLFQFQGTPTVLDPDTGEVVEEGTPANTDYDIDWNALQMLPGEVRATVNVRKYSNLTFNQRFQENFNRVTNRTERWSAALEKDLKLAVLSASMRHHQHLLRHATTSGSTGGCPASACAASRARSGGAGSCSGSMADRGPAPVRRHDTVDDWTRYDFAPTVVAPVPAQLPGPQPLGRLPLHPLRRELRAWTRTDAERDRRPGRLDRSFFETAIEMRGPTFSRVFDTPGLRLLRALQAHDRARGLLDLQDAGRGLQRDPEVRRGRLLPRHQPDRLRARPALLREAPRADRQGACPTSSSAGG